MAYPMSAMVGVPPDLEKGMYGPGQFLGKFEYQLDAVPLDVWSNDITQAALDQREQEDLAWLADYKANGIDAGGDYNLGTDFVVNDGNPDPTSHIIDKEEAKNGVRSITNNVPMLFKQKSMRVYTMVL